MFLFQENCWFDVSLLGFQKYFIQELRSRSWRVFEVSEVTSGDAQGV